MSVFGMGPPRVRSSWTRAQTNRSHLAGQCRRPTPADRCAVATPVHGGAPNRIVRAITDHFEAIANLAPRMGSRSSIKWLPRGMSLKAISKSLTRSEESIKTRAKLDKLDIAKKR